MANIRRRDFQLSPQLIDPSTQWIQCNDQCKGFSATHSKSSDWTQSAQKLDSRDSLNGPPLFVGMCGGTWLDSGDPLFDPVQMDPGDALNGFHAKDLCKVSVEKFSVI